MLCAGLVALLFIGIGLAVLLTAKTHTLKGTLIILAVFGTLAGLPLVGLYLLRQGMRRWVCVFEQGIVTFNGRRAEAYRWDDVEALFEQHVALHHGGAYIGTTHHVRLRFGSARKLTLDNTFAEIEQLASLVRALVDEYQLAKFRAMLQQGRPVGFDGVEMHTTGLDKGEGPLPWGQIESASVETDRAYHVVVRRTGQKAAWLKRPVPRFPNLSAFMQLLQDHGVAVV
jgi:hypothetical protein